MLQQEQRRSRGRLNATQLPSVHGWFLFLTATICTVTASLRSAGCRQAGDVIMSGSVTRRGEVILFGRNRDAVSRQGGGGGIKRVFVGRVDLPGQGEQLVSSRSGNWDRTVGPCVQLLNGEPRGRPSSHSRLFHLSRSSP